MTIALFLLAMLVVIPVTIVFARRAEREACALLCEDGDEYGRWTSWDCACAIRERSK
jgi:hypothetical protein